MILHHDNEPAHTAPSVKESLASKQITVLEHPSYSPDLTPNDFLLFPKITEILYLTILLHSLFNNTLHCDDVVHNILDKGNIEK
jgi:hypothetical protein